MQAQTISNLPTKCNSLEGLHIFIKIRHICMSKAEITPINSPAMGDFQLHCACVNAGTAATSPTSL